MNDDEHDRRDDATGREADERPAIVAYDPYFPATRREADEPRAHRFDPHFSSDGSSDFD
jgi:hypothetical protein